MTELFLYQILHLNRGRIRRLDAHVRHLGAASQAVFGRPYTPSLPRLAQHIAAMAETERYPDGVSEFVRLEIDAEGRERLSPAGVSLYDGYALRSVMPNAISISYDLPAEATTAHEAAAELGRQIAQRAGATEAIRCTAEGIAVAIGTSPLFAIRGRQVFTSPLTLPSVERELGIDAVRAAGLELMEMPIERSELAGFDELFGVDHRGVTALSHYDDIPLMHLMAERIAVAMEELFRK